MTRLDKADQWQKLFSYMLGYQATWVIDVGLKAGLFAAVARHAPATEQVLAERLSLDARYLQVWCRAAFAFELLDWDEAEGYRLAPHMHELLLDPSDTQFLGGRLQFVAALHEDFRAFPRYLREGGSWPRAEHDPFLLQSLESMTRPDAVMIADAVLPQTGLADRLRTEGGRILDVGAGAGFAALHYARRFPLASVVGLEYDDAQVALARRALSEAGLDGVEMRHGDANELADREAFDLITMNVALHETGGPEQWPNVLRRVHTALKPGGVLVVSELPYPDDTWAYREQPVYKALTGVQFHEALVGCGAITQNTLRSLLAAAGFRQTRVADQPLATRFVMMAEK